MIMNGQHNPVTVELTSTIHGIDVETWLREYRRHLTSGQNLNDDAIFRLMYRELGQNMERKKVPFSRAKKGVTRKQYDLLRIENAVRCCVRSFDAEYKLAKTEQEEQELMRLDNLFVNVQVRESKAGVEADNRRKVVVSIAKQIAQEEAEAKAKQEAEAKAKQEAEAKLAELELAKRSTDSVTELSSVELANA
jgi:hypothetical protein